MLKMGPAPRFCCRLCLRNFTKDIMILENHEYTLCLFCDLLHKVTSKADEINTALEIVQKEIGEIKRGERQEINATGVENSQKESDVVCRVEALEEKMAGVESKIDDSGCFQIVKKGSKIRACAAYSGVVTSNAFQVLEDEVMDEPSLILVGDSLVRHQDEEFCKKGPKRKHFCYPGKKIEDITERVDDLVANSSEQTVFTYFVGTNNAKTGKSEEIVKKYKALINKLQESRRRSVICGLIPRYDVDSLTLSRMMGINARVQDLCKKEGVMFVDVWDHFNRDRSLFGKDGLHLSSVGKARLGRVLDESIRKEMESNRTKVQSNQRVAKETSEVRSGEAENSVRIVSEVRHVDVEMTRDLNV